MNGVAVVLAGGEGRRMGGGKPLRAWGGRPLLAQALDLARSYAPDVAVAVRDAGQAGRGAGIPLLFDPPDIGGPLAGLASALDFGRRHGAAWVQILACDMPYLPVDLSDRLARALGAGVGGPAGERWPPASGLRPLARRIARAAGGLSGDGSLVAARLRRARRSAGGGLGGRRTRPLHQSQHPGRPGGLSAVTNNSRPGAGGPIGCAASLSRPGS